MATIENPWVGYLDRSYIQIKNSLLEKLGHIVPEVTDHSESNILVIIISMFAGLVEQLNYYIDNMAREAFITTARRYSSVVKHTRLIDYRIKAVIPASVNIRVSLFGESGTGWIIYGVNVPEINMPQGTEFRTLNGIKFLTTKDVVFKANQTIINIPAEQKTPIVGANLGTTTGNPQQIYTLGEKYVHDSLELKVGGEVWERVDTLGRSGPTDKHYIVDISVDRVAYIVFGDNINGKTPNANQILEGNFYESEGRKGNVGENTIVETDFDFSQYFEDVSQLTIRNPNRAVAGTDYESIERIRRSAPLSIRTLDRAVTRQDYIDIAKLAPGVDKATLHYDCGKFIDIYISPNGGGIASEPLLDSTKRYIDQRKMVTTQIQVLPAGESYIQLHLEVTLRFRRDPIQTRAQIIKKLIDKYSYESSDVNRHIRTSDIIALVDNLPNVDYLTLEKLNIIPYMRPRNHIKELLFTMEILRGTPIPTNFDIRYYRSVMKLFKEGEFVADIPLGVEYVDPEETFKIYISPNNYENGDIWEFKIYPINSNLEISDYSVPVLKESGIRLEIKEQLTLN